MRRRRWILRRSSHSRSLGHGATTTVGFPHASLQPGAGTRDQAAECVFAHTQQATVVRAQRFAAIPSTIAWMDQHGHGEDGDADDLEDRVLAALRALPGAGARDRSAVALQLMGCLNNQGKLATRKAGRAGYPCHARYTLCSIMRQLEWLARSTRNADTPAWRAGWLIGYNRAPR
jgi:hypothetical protein